MIGLFSFTKPVYFIRDPELYKQLAIKDFDSFEDRKFVLDAKNDRLFGNTLVQLEGQRWRDMRNTLSPSFTGTKMRRMFDLMRECAINSVNHYAKECHGGDAIDVDLRDFCLRSANDVIGSCAFGLDVNSHANRKNTFYTNGEKMREYLGSVRAALNILGQRTIPSIMRALNIEFFPKDFRRAFNTDVIDNMEYRHSHGITRPDLIDTMMRLRSAYKSEYPNAKSSAWNDDELVAQCFVFFLAGFDTVAFILCRATYEIAIHGDVQDRLLSEVDQVTQELNGAPMSFDALKGMRYLDMVLSEVLRMYSPTAYVDRVCTKDYNLSYDNVNVTIAKGTEVWFPIHSYQCDAKYFPEPDRFNPERFSDENKATINPSNYVPFGTGPRMCIGNRFALMEIKVMLYYLLKEFRLTPGPNTEIPMQLLSTSFGLQVKNACNLKLVRRN